MRSHETRSTRDRSIPRSLRRWVSTKPSTSQLTFLLSLDQLFWDFFEPFISGVFSDLRSPEIRIIDYATENHPYFCSQFLEGAKISKSFQIWHQFWAVSAASRNWDLLEFCELLVPGMVRLLRTPSAVQHTSTIPTHHTELHLRPTARLRWLLHHMEAIAAAAAAAAAAASSSSSGSSKQQKLQQQQAQKQQQAQQQQQAAEAAASASAAAAAAAPAAPAPAAGAAAAMAAAMAIRHRRWYSSRTCRNHARSRRP